MSRPTVVFFGNELLATGVSTSAPTLQALINAGYEVAAVVTRSEAAASRKPRQLAVAEVAAAHSIPLLLPDKPKDILEQLQAYGASVGVLAAYGRIIPGSVIDIFPHGIINIHPSLLPKHRGPTPIESVILHGESVTGVSIMGLVKAMDAGPIYAQTALPVRPDASKQELADQLLQIGSELVLEVLEQLWAGTAQPLSQDDSQATYDELIRKSDGELDFHKPALVLEREVRAYLGWPGSRTTLGGKEVVITQAHVAAGSGQPGEPWRSGKQLGLYTTQGILVIDRLKPAGKAEMAAEAFLAGYKIE